MKSVRDREPPDTLVEWGGGVRRRENSRARQRNLSEKDKRRWTRPQYN